jgi:uncharacterized protein
MNDRISGDPILSSFRAALTETYGDRLERAVLFGSRARGDARPDSDYDVAVFIRAPDRWFGDVIRLAELGTDTLTDTGAVISARPFRAGACSEPVSLVQEIQCEGPRFVSDAARHRVKARAGRSDGRGIMRVGEIARCSTPWRLLCRPIDFVVYGADHSGKEPLEAGSSCTIQADCVKTRLRRRAAKLPVAGEGLRARMVLNRIQ